MTVIEVIVMATVIILASSLDNRSRLDRILFEMNINRLPKDEQDFLRKEYLADQRTDIKVLFWVAFIAGTVWTIYRLFGE